MYLLYVRWGWTYSDVHLYIILYNHDQTVPIREVTMMSSICDIMNHKPSFKKLCPNIHKIMLYYNTIPLSSATAERTFSSMRRVKTWLRSRMCADTLTNYLFVTIHKERFDLVDTEEIAREFVLQSSQRMNYFGQFKLNWLAHYWLLLLLLLLTLRSLVTMYFVNWTCWMNSIEYCMICIS